MRPSRWDPLPFTIAGFPGWYGQREGGLVSLSSSGRAELSCDLLRALTDNARRERCPRLLPSGGAPAFYRFSHAPGGPLPRGKSHTVPSRGKSPEASRRRFCASSSHTARALGTPPCRRRPTLGRQPFRLPPPPCFALPSLCMLPKTARGGLTQPGPHHRNIFESSHPVLRGRTAQPHRTVPD